MTSLFIATLVASLVGSLHCAGMCGGFVAFYAGQLRGPKAWTAHLAYNGGRLLVYLLLGAIAGGLGAALNLASESFSAQRVAALLAGVTMLVWGSVMMLQSLGLQFPRVRWPSLFTNLLSRVEKNLVAKPPVAQALLLGVSTTLLPCGWLYAFVISAAGSGSAVDGLLLMLAFWLGTVPLLLGLGVGVQQIARRLGRWVPLLSASALIVMGVIALAGRVNMRPGMPHGGDSHRHGITTMHSGQPMSAGGSASGPHSLPVASECCD